MPIDLLARIVTPIRHEISPSIMQICFVYIEVGTGAVRFVVRRIAIWTISIINLCVAFSTFLYDQLFPCQSRVKLKRKLVRLQIILPGTVPTKSTIFLSALFAIFHDNKKSFVLNKGGGARFLRDCFGTPIYTFTNRAILKPHTKNAQGGRQLLSAENAILYVSINTPIERHRELNNSNSFRGAGRSQILIAGTDIPPLRRSYPTLCIARQNHG